MIIGHYARSTVRAALTTLIVLSPACDATGPQSFSPGLTFRVLGSAIDTITAPPVEILLVARDSVDGPIAHAPVSFSFPDTPTGSGRGVQREDTLTQPIPPLETDTTGTFRGLLLYGIATGDWWLRATVVGPHETLVDSVLVHTLPGQPARIALSPRDSALYQGNSENLKATVVDRVGNPRTETAQLEVATTGIQVQGSTVTAVAGPSRQVVRAHYGSITDSAWISIVPHGTIVVRNMRFGSPDYGYVFVSMELDGSNYHAFLLRGGPGNLGNNDKYMAPEWTANGDVVFFDGCPNKQLYRTTTSGVVTPLFPRATENDIWQQLTLDSAWVYFEGTDLGVQSTYLYRSHLDGSGLTLLSPGAPAPYLNDLYPSPSPDGRFVVFATDRPPGDIFNLRLQILDVAADTAHALNQLGNGPRWSPDGQWIAFGNAAAIYIMHPDGSTVSAVSPAGERYEPWTSWSPDGHWLVAEHEGPFIEVLEVATGLRLPLAFTGYLTTPAWRPF